MSIRKSVLTALVVLSSSLTAAHADQIGWGNPWPSQPSQPSQPTQPSRPSLPSEPSRPSDPWGNHSNDPWDHGGSRYDQVVEQNVQRYFERFGSLDLLIDSYSRNQLLGRKIRDIRITMASESGRDSARILANSRQVDAGAFVARDIREYTFRLDSYTNEVGRSLRSLSLEMQGRFYVDKVTFDLEQDGGTIDPFPPTSQTEVLRQQINQTFEREGGINLFRQFPLLERQGQVVRRVTIVAMNRFGLGTAMLLKNSESWGATQTVGQQPTRLTFELSGTDVIGRDLQSLRLQLNGSITVLEVSVEVQGAQSGPWGNGGDRGGDQWPREPRGPRGPMPRR